MESKQRQSHLINELEAAAWIKDGMTLAIGSPTPMALVRQIIRRGVKNLTVIDVGLSLDMLIAAGCVKKVVSYYAGGGFGIPVAPAFRAAAERGEIQVWECEEGILTAGLQAAAQALPFMPWRGGVGTSIPEINPELQIFADPVQGQTLLAVPPIKPDVALLHAAVSDSFGNIQHEGGPGWIDLFLHRAADRTIVQVEKIVSNETVKKDPWATTVAEADAVIRGPYGAHPFYSRGFYVQDNAHLKDYVEASTAATKGMPQALNDYFDRYCRSPKTHADYLEQVGIRRLLELHEF